MIHHGPGMFLLLLFLSNAKGHRLIRKCRLPKVCLCFTIPAALPPIPCRGSKGNLFHIEYSCCCDALRRRDSHRRRARPHPAPAHPSHRPPEAAMTATRFLTGTQTMYSFGAGTNFITTASGVGLNFQNNKFAAGPYATDVLNLWASNPTVSPRCDVRWHPHRHLY